MMELSLSFNYLLSERGLTGLMRLKRFSLKQKNHVNQENPINHGSDNCMAEIPTVPAGRQVTIGKKVNTKQGEGSEFIIQLRTN